MLAAVTAAFIFHNLDAFGAAWVGLFVLSAYGTTRKDAFTRYISFAIFLGFAAALSFHKLHGFNNLPVYERFPFAEDSIGFTMYLNFDKTVVGLIGFLFFVREWPSVRWTRESTLITLTTLGLLVVILMPLALLMHYVRLDLKAPPLAWIWVMNNLFFVCFSEEVIFRGFIQGGLQRRFPKLHWAVPLVLASILFGLAHFPGGPAYVALSTIAGLFYGFAYWKTKRIEASILVHFLTNAIHFFAFSYPALNVNAPL